MIRRLETRAECESAASILGYSLGYSLRDWESRAASIEKNKAAHLGCFEGEELVSVLCIRDFTVYLWGAPVKMGGIGNVATMPRYRYGGRAAALLKAAAAEMRRDGFLISMLYPFSYDFYRRYGWEYTYDDTVCTLCPDDFAHLSKYGDLRPAQPEDVPAMRAILAQLAAQTNLSVAPPDGFDLGDGRMGTGRSYYYIRPELDGFICYDPCDEEGSLELFCPGFEALRAAAGFIGRHDAHGRSVSLPLACGDALRSLMRDPRRMKLSTEPGAMLRVTDLEGLLRALPAAEEGRLVLESSDPILPENSRRLLLEYSAGRCALSDTDAEPDVRTDIFALAKLFTGARSVDEIILEGGMTASGPAARLLSGVYPTRRVHLPLHF